MPPRALEAVLRYAYVHGYSCEQWAEPTKECLQRDGKASVTDLCDLLLSRVFAQTRVSETLLEQYLTFAVTGVADLQHNKDLVSSPLISPETFLLCLFKFVEETVTKNPYQWSHILKLLPAVLTTLDADQVISDLLNQEDEKSSWSHILSEVFIMLSRIVAVGLYRDYYISNKENVEEATTMNMDIAPSFGGNTQPNGSSLPFNFLSQASAFDPDATIYFDNLQDETSGQRAPNTSSDSHSIIDTQSTLYENDKIETSNAILAAQIMVELIEKKSAKRIFEVMNNQQRRLGKADLKAAEPWTTCQAILTPPTPSSSLPSSQNADPLQNTHIQKLLLLINRLTDRDLDQRLAVHLKYHELEDEGTARALPSAGLMGFIYYLVQIRPMPSEEYIVDYLMKLQTIKGAFDESFFLELWFIGLTGLREASTAIEKQELDPSDGSNTNNALITNCLLWRTLVLAKIPRLITQLQLKRQSTLNGARGVKTESSEASEQHNALECSLSELKTFSGLLNGCMASSSAVQMLLMSKDASKAVQEDEDDFMKLLDVNNDTDFDTSAVTDALRALNEQDIFESIVAVCEIHGLVRPHVARELVKRVEYKQESNPDDFSSLLDTDMLEMDDAMSQGNSLQIISQNLDQRISALKENISKTAVTGLFRIALNSMVHTYKIVDFIISLIVEKAETRDVYALAKICEAIIQYPAILDIIGFMHHPSVILGALNRFCTEWSPMDSEMDLDDRSGSENDNDDGIYGIQVLYDRFGKIWTVINMLLLKYNLYNDLGNALPEKDGFCYQLFTEGHIIYGRDVNDSSIEQIVQKWQNELQNNGMISDELLRTSTPQQLLTAAPTLFCNLFLAQETMSVDVESLADAISLFQKRFLSFALVPCSIKVFCEQLQGPSWQFAIQCLERFLVYGYPPKEIIQICGKDILASLGGLAERKRQERLIFQPNEVIASEIDQAQERLAKLQTSIMQILSLEEENNQMRHTETITTNVTSDNLFAKTREMFRSAVKSGRSMFMRDVNADTVALWDPSEAPKQSITHYLDFVMFRVALDIGGPHWFISMIVDEVLEAGKSGGAVRAAELGSCLLATPLTATSGDRQNRCSNLLRCLLQDIIPPSLKTCAETGSSFFQGQTLGVFVSNCLVLMHDRDDDKDFIHALGRIFFETLLVDSENAPHIIHRKEEQVADDSLVSDYVLAQWSDVITQSPVWRGFIKGLMSNPLVNEAWPNTFI